MWFVFAALAEAPLAIPAQPDAQEAPAPPPPRRDLALALSQYRQRSTSVRRYTTLHGGGATAVGWGWGWPGFGSPYGGFSTTYIVGNPTYEIEHWAVYSGARRLTVPEWLDLADAPDARADLRRRVRRTKTWHGIMIGTAIAGGVALVGSSWGSQSAQTYDEFENWQLASSAGASALVVGIAGGFATGIHARNLRYDYDRSQDLAQTQEWVRRYNANLRSELGLTPDQTAPVDRGE